VISSTSVEEGQCSRAGRKYDFLNPTSPSFPFFESRTHEFARIIEKLQGRKENTSPERSDHRERYDLSLRFSTQIDHTLRSTLQRSRRIRGSSAPGRLSTINEHAPYRSSPSPWFHFFPSHRAIFSAIEDFLLQPPFLRDEVGSTTLVASCVQNALEQALKVFDGDKIDDVSAISSNGIESNSCSSIPFDSHGVPAYLISSGCKVSTRKRLRRDTSVSPLGGVDRSSNLISISVAFPDLRRGFSVTSSQAEIDLEQTQTVEDLKYILVDLTGLPLSKIKVRHPTYGFLKDREWLKNYDLQSGQSLCVEVKSRGGGRVRNA